MTKQELEAAKKENDRLATQLRTTTIDKKQLEQALESVSQDKERFVVRLEFLKHDEEKIKDSSLIKALEVFIWHCLIMLEPASWKTLLPVSKRVSVCITVNLAPGQISLKSDLPQKSQIGP